jgi:hypothetical protein
MYQIMDFSPILKDSGTPARRSRRAGEVLDLAD